MKREDPRFRTSPPGEVLLATDSLLKIDVEAELRKLAGAQLHAAWQLPTELMRLALAGGAQSADLRLRGERLELEAPGWRVSGRTMQALELLFGRRERLDDLHAALVALEGEESLGWIALTTQIKLELDLVIETEEGFYSLRASGGRSQLRPHAPPAPAASRLRLAGLELEQRQAISHLRQSTRFSSLPVTVNGKRPDAPFKDAIDVAALSEGLRGAMALTRKGQAPRVWLTRHGVLAAHFTAARGPGIELVVEVGRELPAHATAADLRERGERDLHPAMLQLTKRLAWLSEQELAPADRRRLCELSLECAAAGGDGRVLSRLPLFERRDREGSTSPWTLLELRQGLEDTPGRHCFALRPEDDYREFDLSTPVVILDDRLRASLAKALSIDFRPPPVRENRESQFSRVMRSLRMFWDRAVDPLRRTRFAGREIPPEVWTPAERALHDSLRKHLPSELSVHLCQGKFETRASERALWLARGDDLVRAAGKACLEDPRWAYPALIALAGGHVDVSRGRGAWVSHQGSALS